MAEIFILVIFLLLLAFADLLRKQHDENVALEQKIQLIEKHGADIDKIIEVVSKKPDLTKELVEATTNISPLIEDIVQNKILKEKETVSEFLNKSVKEEISKRKELLNTKDKPGSLEQQLQLAQQQKDELNDEVENLKGQNDNLTSQMKGEGKSVDPPPCWPDNFKKGGWKDSIFRVDLTSAGISLQDNAPAERAEEKARLPLTGIQLSKVLSSSVFEEQTRPLFNWSVEHECRFLVLVEDKTGQSEKVKYKALLKTVENHFYKKEIGLVDNSVDTNAASAEKEEVAPQPVEEKSWLEKVLTPLPPTQKKKKFN